MADITPTKVNKKPKFMVLQEDQVNSSNFPMGMKMGGYSVGAHNLRQGKVQFQSSQEVIKIGDVEDILDGIGIYLGPHIENNGDEDYEFRAGDPDNDYIHWDGDTLEVKGSITAEDGTIGGWNISSIALISGNVNINSNLEQILIGSVSGPLAGTGIFMGKDGSDYEFRAGNPSGNYIHWDGSQLNIIGLVQTSDGSSRIELNPSLGVMRDLESGNVRTVIGNGTVEFFTPLGVASGAIFGFGTQQLAVNVTGSEHFFFNPTAFFGNEVRDLGTSSEPWGSIFLESPDGTVWEVTVDNTGNLQVT